MNHSQRWRYIVVAVMAASCGGAPERDIRFESFGEGLCPAGSVVQGVDVSSYQDTINWSSVKGAGIAFAIARVSDGTDLDGNFATNWNGMKTAGLVRGMYQYFEPGEDPATQANIVINAVGMLGAGDLPAVADMEATGGQSAAAIAANLQTWASAVESGTGKKPMIYTAEGYWDSDVNSSAFSSNPLWVANWGVNCPSIPSGWSSFSVWQYSDSGTVAGIPDAVDLDEFNGTEADLQTFAGGAASPIYGASYVSQSWPFATTAFTMTAGETLAANMVLKNSGTATWDSKTRLATTEPEDRASPFADSTWVSDNRLAEVSGTVAPGGTFQFNFVFHAPGAPGNYDEFYGMVEDGVTWFSAAGQGGPPDNQFEAKITVIAAPDSGMPPPPVDAGIPPPPVDAGIADAGTRIPEDAGTPPRDAGSPVAEDAGNPSADVVDAGPTEPRPAGCGCGSSPAGTAALGLLLLAFRRRRAPHLHGH